MKRWHIVTSIVVIVLAMAAFLLFSVDNTVNASEIIPNSRPQYDSIPNEVFKDLPDYPSNFVILKRDIFNGQITNLNKIPDNIYKQPELYPTWETNGQKWFTDHDYSRWGVHGYGFFPGEISYDISNMAAGDEVNTHSFLHTSWGIETWQGLKLIPVYDHDYFDVSITPSETLLEPTFPKFYNNWSQKINMHIIAKEQVPQGDYSFSIKFGTPSNLNSNTWMWEVLDKYTDNQYHDEIQKCKDSLSQKEKCDSLIGLKQNKYISGDTFAPSNQFTVKINVI